MLKALNNDGFTTNYIRCLQRKPAGEMYLTFCTADLHDKFIQQRSFSSTGKPHVANDADGSTVFLTIYDAPYELLDTAIIHRLRPFCEVLWYLRDPFRAHDGVFNGLRHFRVRMLNAIPSYLCFGKFLLRLSHDGQVPTFRRCNRRGHQASACGNTICFDCDGLGHTTHDCVKPMYRCICKSGQHLAQSCSFSCHRPVSPRASHVVDLEEDLAMSHGCVKNSPAVDLESHSPHPPSFRRLVVDPESVLAENSVQDHPSEELESEEIENDQAGVVETQQSDVDSTGLRILDSQGRLVSSVSPPRSAYSSCGAAC